MTRARSMSFRSSLPPNRGSTRALSCHVSLAAPVQILEFIKNTTMVGLLPVPHPIVRVCESGRPVPRPRYLTPASGLIRSSASISPITTPACGSPPSCGASSSCRIRYCRFTTAPPSSSSRSRALPTLKHKTRRVIRSTRARGARIPGGSPSAAASRARGKPSTLALSSRNSPAASLMRETSTHSLDLDDKSVCTLMILLRIATAGTRTRAARAGSASTCP